MKYQQQAILIHVYPSGLSNFQSKKNIAILISPSFKICKLCIPHILPPFNEYAKMLAKSTEKIY